MNLDNEQVIVETTLPTGKVQELIENSGRMAILRGLGTPGNIVPFFLLQAGRILLFLYIFSSDAFSNSDQVRLEAILVNCTPLF